MIKQLLKIKYHKEKKIRSIISSLDVEKKGIYLQQEEIEKKLGVTYAKWREKGANMGFMNHDEINNLRISLNYFRINENKLIQEKESLRIELDIIEKKTTQLELALKSALIKKEKIQIMLDELLGVAQ